jgi:hypothetical protein
VEFFGVVAGWGSVGEIFGLVRGWSCVGEFFGVVAGWSSLDDFYGRVAEWSGTGLQNLSRRFDSAHDLELTLWWCFFIGKQLLEKKGSYFHTTLSLLIGGLIRLALFRAGKRRAKECFE